MSGSAYWSAYKRIEDEVIELSYSIHFDDTQINVYSNEILDLIIRICTNIESLYEDIYRAEFGETEEKIGAMVNQLGTTFNLEEKIVNISNDNFHFIKELKSIRPFKYKRRGDADFYSIYNAIKHNRSKNVQKANIFTLLRSLAAFYALCVIFDNRVAPLQNSVFGTEVPDTFTYNSKIFSANVYNEQLDIAEQSFRTLAAQIDGANNNQASCADELSTQCEKNLKIKFKEQKPAECLFVTKLAPEYSKKLEDFKARYENDATATKTEISLLLGDRSNDSPIKDLDIDSLDVLMEHITLNLSKTIMVVAVNRPN